MDPKWSETQVRNFLQTESLDLDEWKAVLASGVHHSLVLSTLLVADKETDPLFDTYIAPEQQRALFLQAVHTPFRDLSLRPFLLRHLQNQEWKPDMIPHPELFPALTQEKIIYDLAVAKDSPIQSDTGLWGEWIRYLSGTLLRFEPGNLYRCFGRLAKRTLPSNSEIDLQPYVLAMVLDAGIVCVDPLIWFKQLIRLNLAGRVQFCQALLTSPSASRLESLRPFSLMMACVDTEVAELVNVCTRMYTSVDTRYHIHTQIIRRGKWALASRLGNLFTHQLTNADWASGYENLDHSTLDSNSIDVLKDCGCPFPLRLSLGESKPERYDVVDYYLNSLYKNGFDTNLLAIEPAVIDEVVIDNNILFDRILSKNWDSVVTVNVATRFARLLADKPRFREYERLEQFIVQHTS